MIVVNSRFETYAGQRDGFWTHWSWCLPVILVVAFLSLRQIDLYPPTPDEFFSMNNAGWLANGPFAPVDVIESLYNTAPDHVPGYFMLLNVWGKLTSTELATGRVFSVLCGLLSLAVIYRLARDFVAPPAGIFAIVVAAGNAFYNFYIPHMRVYPLLLLLAGIVLWLYLRIILLLDNARIRDYIALGVAVYLCLNAHPFSAAFLITLAIYHVIFVRRDHKWRRIVATVSFAAAAFLPWLMVLLTKGRELAIANWGESSAGAWDTIGTWLIVTTNGQPLLLFMSVAGLGLAASRGRFPLQPIVVLPVTFAIVLGLLTDATSYISTSGSRYQLPAWHFMLLIVGSGLYFLHCFKRWLGLLVILWVVAGLILQSTTEWSPYIAGRTLSFMYPPWQVIARQMSQDHKEPQLIVYRISDERLNWPGNINYRQRQHYFDDAGIRIQFAEDPHDFALMIRRSAIVSPHIWVVLQTSIASEDEIANIRTTMENLDYDLCESRDLGVDTIILELSWNVASCTRMDPVLLAASDIIEYRFFGADLVTNSSTLYFADGWSPVTDESLQDYMISFQLMSPDWDNVAQLDLPLVHEGVPRRFSIDIAHVEPGNYRLVAILYNRHSGTRITWFENDSFLPDMLLLSELVL